MCPGDWEPRQPQDLIKGVPDNQSVPVSRPPPPPIFTPWHYTPSVIDTLSLVEQIGVSLLAEIYDKSPRGAVNSMGINRSSINGTFTAVEQSDREMLHLTEDIAVIDTDHVPELNPDNVGFSDRLIGTLGVGLHNTLNIGEQIRLNLNTSAGSDKIGFTDTNNANISPSLLDSLAFNETVYILKIAGTINGSRINARSINR